jgi:2-polyprenyl-3-methyl-5-hydroxy-6-metoxy-1,4-benzoquinol methylase
MSGALLNPQKRALEIGCGTGMFTEMFAQTGAGILAVDISSDLLEAAGKRGNAENYIKEAKYDMAVGHFLLQSF